MAKMSIAMPTLSSVTVMDEVTKPLGLLNINNSPINRITNPASNLIFRVTERMRASETIEPTQAGSANDMCYRILTSIGCSFIKQGPKIRTDYSLMMEQLDTETVQNPNKIEILQFANIQKMTFSLDGVFGDANDSIFQLDQAIPRAYIEQISTSQSTVQQASPIGDVTALTLKVINLNLNIPTHPSLRGLMGV